MVVTRGWGEVEIGVIANGVTDSVWNKENGLEMDGGNDDTMLLVYCCGLNVSPKSWFVGNLIPNQIHMSMTFGDGTFGRQLRFIS
jgi:hypothetical protein